MYSSWLVWLVLPALENLSAVRNFLMFMPSTAIINMDSYIDGTRAIDGDFDDKRLTDYDTLLDNIHGLKGWQICSGIYALSEKLRPLLDLRVSVTGGMHLNLVYPTYEALIEPDLKTAHINIFNTFEPYGGFHNPTYTLKGYNNTLYFGAFPGFVIPYIVGNEGCEDPLEACQSFLRMRNRDGKYYLTFEIENRDGYGSMEVNVRFLGGLMALGYTVSAILERKSHIFDDDKVTVCEERLFRTTEPDIYYIEKKERKSHGERQLSHRRRSRGPDILFIHYTRDDGSVCHYICDGLVCFYTNYRPSVCVVVVNPATRWHQSLPLARVQQLCIDKIILLHSPVYVDGSLCWLTDGEETKVLSFDLHTETFQVICKAPFSDVHDPFRYSMCILNNCLCVSERYCTTQDIWLLDSSDGNINTWKKMCSIDITKTSSLVWIKSPTLNDSGFR
ncbi:hypothetical protein Rs2_23811 [Raphanus sativus]|nr:hypothetical protein Rs2_23811 [Raphanus sativus]